MRTVEPLTGAAQVTLAVGQDEYEPLVVAMYVETTLGTPVCVSRWKPSDQERERIARGEDLYLSLLTFGGAPQPVSLQVGDNGLRAGATYPNYEPMAETP